MALLTELSRASRGPNGLDGSLRQAASGTSGSQGLKGGHPGDGAVANVLSSEASGLMHGWSKTFRRVVAL